MRHREPKSIRPTVKRVLLRRESLLLLGPEPVFNTVSFFPRREIPSLRRGFSLSSKEGRFLSAQRFLSLPKEGMTLSEQRFLPLP